MTWTLEIDKRLVRYFGEGLTTDEIGRRLSTPDVEVTGREVRARITALRRNGVQLPRRKAEQLDAADVAELNKIAAGH